MKTDNQMTKVIGFIVLSLLFAGVLLAGSHRVGFQEQTCPGMVWIQSEGICMSDGEEWPADRALVEQNLNWTALSLHLRQNVAARTSESKFNIESFLAVLFKIAVIPCLVFTVFYCTRGVDTFLRKIICDFLHWQDGKKRWAFSG